MRAWTVHEFGAHADVLHLENAQAAACSDNGVVVRVSAIGVSFPDVLMVAGKYQVRPPLPFVPGHEAVGVVVSAGARSRRRPGERVVVFAPLGTYAEEVAVPDAHALDVPAKMSDDEAAGFVVGYQTSYFALVHRARIVAGEWLLVHGGAGAVGTAAIQIGKALGARVIATAAATKHDTCRAAGADHVLDDGERGLGARIREITAGHGVDVVCDPVGGDLFDESTRCLAWSGRLVSVGFAAGRIPSIDVNRILLKNISILGLHWGTYDVQQPELIAPAHEHLCRLFEAGQIAPLIGQTFPFSRLPDGLTAIAERQSRGRVIIRMNEEA
jgi:NADPH2:quinone reductase